MHFYVCKAARFPFVAFWRMDDKKVCFFILDSEIYNFERSIVDSVFYLNKTLMGIEIDDSEEMLFEFAQHVIDDIYKKRGFKIVDVQVSRFNLNDKNRRVWRGIIGDGSSQALTPHHGLTHEDYKFKITAARNASLLFSSFGDIFSFVEPSTDNYPTYSLRLRELLILACTEIEANFIGVLKANSVRPTRKNWSTVDYVKLVEVLKLKSWSVVLKFRSDVGSTHPYESWSNDMPTKTLPWFEAYNAVKHDAIHSLPQASFKHVYEAMSALYILHLAQWGPNVFENLQLPTPFVYVEFPEFDVNEIPVLAAGENSKYIPLAI